MPQTRFESFVFTLMMVFCMVYCMTVYTVSLGSGGLAYAVFGAAIREMWVEYLVVFLLMFFVITKNAQRLAFRVVTPGKDNPLLVTLAIQCFTVCQIVPVITLFAAVLHGGLTADLLTRWITLAVQCFPMALCLQVFFIGPLVRLVFRSIFRRQAQGTGRKRAAGAAEHAG